jgi:hypothetical protein
MASIKAYSKMDYVVSFEIALRGPGGPLQGLLDYSKSDECPVKSRGIFVAYGDIHPRDGVKVLSVVLSYSPASARPAYTSPDSKEQMRSRGSETALQ